MATRFLVVLLVNRALAAVPEPRRGIWGYFCYQDTASIAGSEPDPDFYPTRCWQEQSVKAPEATGGTLMLIKWRHIEPSPGVYNWSAVDANITKATQLGLQLILAIEVCKADPKDEATPDWLYDQVPGVNFSKSANPPPSATNNHRCPYYLDTGFQAIFGRLVSAFATHVASLPVPERAMVVGVQAMLGITGDDRPWNGVPINPAYVISDAEWTNYTRRMALAYCAAFTAVDTRVLYNLENPGVNGMDDPWILEQCPGSLIKQGIVSHGYQLNGELDLSIQVRNVNKNTTHRRTHTIVSSSNTH
jgi:hypothetical protein